GIVAPPLFTNVIALGMGGAPIPGFAAFVAGAEWEWFRTINADDKITVEDVPTDIIDKTGGKGRRQFLLLGKIVYKNQKDEVVAVCKRMTMSIELGEKALNEKDGSKNAQRGRYRYGKAELNAIEQAYQAEEIRGANPRYWENVTEGEELKPVVKGPLTYGDMLAFLASVGWMGEAHGLARELFRKYPEFAYTDPETGITEWHFMGHIIDRVSWQSGLPGAIAMGIQTCCWLGHLTTNWMGDDGFLKSLGAQCRDIICVGDTTWCKGKVTRKYVANNEHLVDCEVWAENQYGKITTPGHATIVLPSREQ
ncbi:MAG: hypothetical protein FJZ88_04940, partial [Chloroflexi bacterium]|nr:hypothetical protein [Chloroflexota bacterium]